MMMPLKHHVQGDVVEGRPGYRESMNDRAVKVYTVNLESKYLLVQNVHALGITNELLELFSLYGEITEHTYSKSSDYTFNPRRSCSFFTSLKEQLYRILEEFPTEPYSEAYWIKFCNIDSARTAKQKLDNHFFYGNVLHVCYAPESEKVSDVREKLHQRRSRVTHMTRGDLSKETTFSAGKSFKKSLTSAAYMKSECAVKQGRRRI